MYRYGFLIFAMFPTFFFVVQTKKNCRENAHVCCEKLLKKSSIMDLVKVLETQADRKKFCTEKSEAIRCIQMYRNCLTTNDLNYYNKVTSGIRNFHEHACHEKSEELLNNADCFYQNHKKLAKCANDKLDYKKLIKLGNKEKCCAIDNYHMCIRKPLIANCFLRAADVMSELIDEYFSTVSKSCDKNEGGYDCRSSCATSLLIPFIVLSLFSVLAAFLAA